MKRSILASFAHPDDETSVGPLLAKYAREGHDVWLVSITSGQRGVKHNTFEPGEALGLVRADELRCAARQLGIQEPILLGFQDQGISGIAVMEKVAARLREIIDEKKPDVVITFGAGGVTGHIDHIAAGEVTTQVFQQQGLLHHKPRKLYYVAFPESRFERAPDRLKQRRPFHVTTDAFLTTVVDCRDYLQHAAAALHCHKTQFTPDFVKQLEAMHDEVFEGRIHLRLAISALPQNHCPEQSILEGLI